MKSRGCGVTCAGSLVGASVGTSSEWRRMEDWTQLHTDIPYG